MSTNNASFKINYEIIDHVLPHDTLFIHGNLSSNRWWYPSLEIWKTQSKNQNYTGRAILAEFRGHGLSSPPKNLSEINVHTFANDYLELISLLGFKNLNIVGHSTGGIVAAIMLSKNPSIFNKGILLNSVGVNGYIINKNSAAAHEIMKVNKKLTTKAIGAVIYNNSEDDFFHNVIVEDAYTAVKNVGAAVLSSLATINVADEMKKITNEVLVVHGVEDILLSIDNSKELAQLIPNAKFIEITEQGHSLNIENPEKFVTIVNNFLFKKLA